MSSLITRLQSSEASTADYFTVLIRMMVWITVTTIWIVVGFLFWIPFLLRIVFYYTGMVVISTFTDADMQPAENSLASAITFYTTGFSKVNRLLVSSDKHTRGYRDLESRDFAYLLTNIFFSVVFWAAVGIVVFDPPAMQWLTNFQVDLEPFHRFIAHI